ncbi:MAG: hypothetical protein WCP36_05580, partial [Methanomicrobiales archaeon]
IYILRISRSISSGILIKVSYRNPCFCKPLGSGGSPGPVPGQIKVTGMHGCTVYRKRPVSSEVTAR